MAAFLAGGAALVEFDLVVEFTDAAAFFAGATFVVDDACGLACVLACSTALAAPAVLVVFSAFLAGPPADEAAALGAGFAAGLVVELFADFAADVAAELLVWTAFSTLVAAAARVGLAVTSCEPALAAPVALADRIVLAGALAGAAFFTAVTSTSFQGVVDLAPVRCERSERVFLDLW